MTGEAHPQLCKHSIFYFLTWTVKIYLNLFSPPGISLCICNKFFVLNIILGKSVVSIMNYEEKGIPVVVYNSWPIHGHFFTWVACTHWEVDVYLMCFFRHLSFLLGKFSGKEVTWRKWSHLFLQTIHYAVSYSHEFWMSLVITPPRCWSWFRATSSTTQTQPASVSRGREQVRERPTSLWHMVVAFFP